MSWCNVNAFGIMNAEAFCYGLVVILQHIYVPQQKMANIKKLMCTR